MSSNKIKEREEEESEIVEIFKSRFQDFIFFIDKKENKNLEDKIMRLEGSLIDYLKFLED